MNESPLVVKSKEFALAVIKSCKELRNAKCESALINQFLRSGTSVGANIREAFYAHGRADFIAKLQIALKECSESEYWIELLTESGYSSDKEILYKCIELKKNTDFIIKHRKEKLVIHFQHKKITDTQLNVSVKFYYPLCFKLFLFPGTGYIENY